MAETDTGSSQNIDPVADKSLSEIGEAYADATERWAWAYLKAKNGTRRGQQTVTDTEAKAIADCEVNLTRYRVEYEVAMAMWSSPAWYVKHDEALPPPLPPSGALLPEPSSPLFWNNNSNTAHPLFKTPTFGEV